jgi:hypothetical protein
MTAWPLARMAIGGRNPIGFRQRNGRVTYSAYRLLERLRQGRHGDPVRSE